MSLINDALKRVKEAQRQAPPSAELDLQLRPVEPPASMVHNSGMLLPIALVALSVLALLLVWVLARRGGPSDVLTVRAETPVHESPTAHRSSPAMEPLEQKAPPAAMLKPESAKLAPTVETAGSTSNTTVKTGATIPSAVVTSSPTGQAPAELATNNVDAKTTAPDLSAKTPSTNSSSTTESEAPKPAPLKLQGVFFSKKPSALINGRTVFVGDRVREFRVVAITPDKAILTAGGRTNVLSFSE